MESIAGGAAKVEGFIGWKGHGAPPGKTSNCIQYTNSAQGASTGNRVRAPFRHCPAQGSHRKL